MSGFFPELVAELGICHFSVKWYFTDSSRERLARPKSGMVVSKGMLACKKKITQIQVKRFRSHTGIKCF